MSRNYLFVLWIPIFLLSHSPCLAQLTPKETKAITAWGKSMDQDLKRDKLHGSISAALIRKGQVIWSGAFGYVAMDKDSPADTGTIYRIASITKMFTATLLLQLAEEGKLGLDDPLENYVPEVKSLPGYSRSTRMTLRQLASHTSGLNREPELAGASLGPPDEWENKVLACIPTASFNSGPGERFLYSNMGFALLGLALERAAGIPYIQLVQQHIFTPLHMDNSFFTVPADKRDRLAQGIDNKKEGGANTRLPLEQVDGMGYRVPNGGIWSTPADLAKFVIALNSGQLIKPASIKQMLRVPPGGKNYGLGMMIMPDRMMTTIGHNGSDPGYTSQLCMDPNSGDAVILMRNYNFEETNLEDAARDLLQRL